jgi:hypothetical protein
MLISRKSVDALGECQCICGSQADVSIALQIEQNYAMTGSARKNQFADEISVCRCEGAIVRLWIFSLLLHLEFAAVHFRQFLV